MNSIGPYTIIISGSIIVLLSFIFSTVAKKTNIPAVLLLISLGVGIQYLLAYIGLTEIDFFPVLEVLGIVGLIMIVLEAALELKLERNKFGLIFKSFLAALAGLALSVGSAAVVIFFLVKDMNPLQALLYATPLSILSSAIIIPSVGNLSNEKKEFHIYESTFSDILGIMLFYFIIGLIESRSPIEGMEHSGENPVMTFFISLGLTVVIALLASYLLVIIFQHIKSGAKLFLLIAMLLLLYALGKKMHLSPLIIILVFGLVISNSNLFFLGKLRAFLHLEKFKSLEHGLHVVTLESAFVVRTFFFVIFGASIVLSSLLSFKVLIISLTILATIYTVRWLCLRFFVGADLTPQLWVAPRGLITVLLFYAIPSEQINNHFDPGILLFIIIATGVFMSIGMIVASKREKTPLPEKPSHTFTFGNKELPQIENKS